MQPTDAAGATTSANNGLIAVGGDYTLDMVAPDRSALYTVLRKVNDYQHWYTPAWSPDGTTLAVDSDDESEGGSGLTVRVGDREGNLEPFQINGEDPTWTPDGNLVVVRPGPTGSRLWLVDRNGQDIRPLDIGGDSVQVTNPKVSPDGRTVAYERTAPGDPRAIYTAPITGGTEQRVDTGQTQWARSVDWSPDGTHLLFVADGALRTIGVDGTDRRELVPSSESVSGATWSPDGSLIAYYSSPSMSVHLLDVTTGATLPAPGIESVSYWGGIDWQPLPACSVQGTAAAESLTGTAGDDVICAGGGDDVIEETPGDDIVLGGDGQDVVEYDTSLPGVQVHLERVHSRGAGDDMPLDVEGVVGTDGPDTLIGDHNAETLRGGAGNDLIAGGRGADILAGGDGRDTLTSNYDENGGEYYGYVIDLAAGTSVERAPSGDPVIDTLSGFEDVIGTPYADLIRGDDTDNLLQGSPVPAHSSDEFEGRGGDDTIIGPGTAIYSEAPSAVDVNLVRGTASGGDGNDTLTGPTNAQGSAFGDHFRLAASSVVDGNAGNDSAVLTNVADFHGGAGRDLADLSRLPWGAAIENQYGIWDSRSYDGANPNYEMTDVERYVLTPFVDTYEGSAESEAVSAGRGNDWIYAGPQSVTGPNGPVHDRLLAGRGHDTLVGGWSSGPLVVDLAAGWGQAPGVDVVRGFEAAWGSPYDDRISGDDLANWLTGKEGDDVLRGRAGPDRLDGGPGADVVRGGTGSDQCGSDRADTVTGCP